MNKWDDITMVLVIAGAFFTLIGVLVMFGAFGKCEIVHKHGSGPKPVWASPGGGKGGDSIICGEGN